MGGLLKAAWGALFVYVGAKYISEAVNDAREEKRERERAEHDVERRIFALEDRVLTTPCEKCGEPMRQGDARWFSKTGERCQTCGPEDKSTEKKA